METGSAAAESVCMRVDGEWMVGKMEGPREVGRSMNFWRERIGGDSRDEEVGNWGR